MNIEEKKQEIIKALLKKEISGNKINPKSKGKYAGKLSKGENVKDSIIERMYQNLIDYRNNGNNKPNVKATTKINDNKIDNKKVMSKSKNVKIDNKQSNKTDNKIQELIQENKDLKEENQKLNNYIVILKNTNESKLEITKNDNKTLLSEIEKLHNIINTMNESLSVLENNYTELKEQMITSINNKKATKQEIVDLTNDKVLGFNINFQDVQIKNKNGEIIKYKKYFAKKRDIRIYIGNDKSKAEEKIKAYHEKHNLDLESLGV